MCQQGVNFFKAAIDQPSKNFFCWCGPAAKKQPGTQRLQKILPIGEDAKQVLCFAGAGIFSVQEALQLACILHCKKPSSLAMLCMLAKMPPSWHFGDN